MQKPSNSTGPQSRVVKAGDFRGNLADFLTEYRNQGRLTKKLDDPGNLNFTSDLVNEFVLWKVNRFVSLEKDQLDRLDALKTLKAGAHRQARSVIH
jgi:hypothetical protein